MEELKQLIIRLLDEGENPNSIGDVIEDTIIKHGKWALFGDGHWRIDTVCSICGSWMAGICGHEEDPERQVILRSEYETH